MRAGPINKYREHMNIHSGHSSKQMKGTQGRERRVDLHCGQSGDQCTCYNYKNKKPPKS